MYQEKLNDQIQIAYQDLKIQPKDRVLFFDEQGNYMQKVSEAQEFFSYEDLMAESKDCSDSDFYYMFSIDEEKYFLLVRSLPENLGKNFSAVPRRKVFDQHTEESSYIVLTAAHIHDWFKRTKFCGACGQETIVRTDERAKTCKHCGNRIYPQISPVVIVAVSNANELLLTKYANRAHKRYALVAGFVEVGETLEAAVKREVMEETGVRVKNIEYFNSQPWGITGGLLSGFFADLDGDSALTVDYEELHEASWIAAEDIQKMELNTKSLTGTLIDVWRQKSSFLVE